MQRLQLVPFVFCLITAALAAPSPTPKWPREFKTAFEFEEKENRTKNVGAWEYSEEYQSERWNHNFPEDTGVVTVIRRYDIGKQFVVRTIRGQRQSCFQAYLKGELEHPDFASLKYLHAEKVGQQTVDVWENETFIYKDWSKTEIPFELVDEKAETSMLFRKFVPQELSPDIFYPPKACNHTMAHRGTPSYFKHCSFLNKLKCAAIIALCAAACCAGGCVIDPGCINCMGGAWDACKGCF